MRFHAILSMQCGGLVFSKTGIWSKAKVLAYCCIASWLSHLGNQGIKSLTASSWIWKELTGVEYMVKTLSSPCLRQPTEGELTSGHFREQGRSLLGSPGLQNLSWTSHHLAGGWMNSIKWLTIHIASLTAFLKRDRTQEHELECCSSVESSTYWVVFVSPYSLLCFISSLSLWMNLEWTSLSPFTGKYWGYSDTED